MSQWSDDKHHFRCDYCDKHVSISPRDTQNIVHAKWWILTVNEPSEGNRVEYDLHFCSKDHLQSYLVSYPNLTRRSEVISSTE